MLRRPSLNRPTYDSTKDGNVFQWILEASEDFRKIRQRERFKQLEALTDTHKHDNQRHKYL